MSQFIGKFYAGDHLDDPDTYSQKVKIIGDSGPPYNADMILGKKGGKNSKDYAVFVRWEVGIPKGAQIEGLKISFGVSGLYDTDAGSQIALDGGWVLPDGKWEEPGGVENWPTTADIPFAEWDSGASTDYDVFQGGVRGFSGEAHTIRSVANFDLTSSYGQIASSVSYTFKSQLVDYLDDHEGLRGHTYQDHIPVMLHLYREFDSFEDHYQGLLGSETVQRQDRPKLFIEYSLPWAKSELVGDGVSIKSVQGSATSVQLISGAGVSTQSVIGSGSSMASLIGNAVSKTTLAGGAT